MKQKTLSNLKMPDYTVRMLENLRRIFLTKEGEGTDAEILLRSILDSATEYAIIATDLEKNIITWNKGAEKIFGYSPEEIIGKRKLSFLIPDEENKSKSAIENIQKELAHHGVWMGETLRKRKNGQNFYARIIVTRLKSKNKIIGTVAIIRDITKEKELSSKIEEYAKTLEDKVAQRTAELQKSNRLIEQEIHFAKLIQRTMLKNSIHKIPQYHCYFQYYPAKEIGGDFFTVDKIDDEHFYFYISDVSGHGIPAALLTVYAHHTIRNIIISNKIYSPGNVLRILNNLFIKENFPGAPFLTIFFCVLDLKNNTLTCASAGHPQAIFFNENESFFFGKTGKPVGVFENQEYPESLIPVKKNDNIFLYTDGLTEIFDRNGHRLFDPERLLGFLSSNNKQTDILKMLIKHIKGLRKDLSSFEDDVAILYIKRME